MNIWCCVYSCCDLLACVKGVWCFPRGWPSALLRGGSQPICYLRHRAVMPLSAHRLSINPAFSWCYYANVLKWFHLLIVRNILFRLNRFLFIYLFYLAICHFFGHFFFSLIISPKYYLSYKILFVQVYCLHSVWQYLAFPVKKNVFLVELDFFSHVCSFWPSAVCWVMFQRATFKFCIKKRMNEASTCSSYSTVSVAGVPFCLVKVRILVVPFYGRLAWRPNWTSSKSCWRGFTHR